MRAAALLVLACSLAACGSGQRGTAGGRVRVVAAENVWGSIASQVGGAHAQVTSIVASPAADPHDYEPTAVDARKLADAQLAIVNGAGYDPWAPRLLSASPAGGRLVLTVGNLVGVGAGGNPHRWYSPTDVRRVVAALAADYERLDPAHARYFERQRVRFEQRGLAAYDRELALIRRRFAGVAVGASESIFALLAPALGLKLVTPPSFLKAISEGGEPTAGDRATVDRQIATGQIKAWIYNSQNSTPDVRRLTSAARSRGIPVTTITESLVPAGTTFQAWQVAQLRALAAALARGTGR